jgi:hypothetical protein
MPYRKPTTGTDEAIQLTTIWSLPVSPMRLFQITIFNSHHEVVLTLTFVGSMVTVSTKCPATHLLCLHYQELILDLLAQVGYRTVQGLEDHLHGA